VLPIIITIIAAIIFLASVVLPIKWILEDKEANVYEKTIFIGLTLIIAILSYYLFIFYLRHFKKM